MVMLVVQYGSVPDDFLSKQMTKKCSKSSRTISRGEVHIILSQQQAFKLVNSSLHYEAP